MGLSQSPVKEAGTLTSIYFCVCRLLYAVESIPRELLPSKKYVSRQSGSIAIEALSVSASHFPGIACFAHATDEDDNNSFKCSTTINQTAILHPNQKVQPNSTRAKRYNPSCTRVKRYNPSCTRTKRYSPPRIRYNPSCT